MQQRIRLGINVGVTALMALAGCGGGDSTPSTAVVATTAQSTGMPSPTPVPSPAPTPSPSTANCGLGDISAHVLAQMNAERAKGADCRSKGVFAATGVLRWNTQLERAALGHSQDMEKNNLFSHTGSDQRTLADRVSATGYHWSRLGENIAAGYPDIHAVVAAWMASDGHCANMMDPNFTEVALSCVARTGTADYSNYWTLDFGTPK